MHAFTRRATRRLSKRKDDLSSDVDPKPSTGPNLLQKRLQGRDSLLKSKEKNISLAGGSSKKKFSLRDVVRKILGKKQSPDHNLTSKAKDQETPDSGIGHSQDDAERTPVPVEAQTDGTANVSLSDQKPETVPENPALSDDVAHQRGISMASTLSTISNGSLNLPSISSLSPRPAAPLQSYKFSPLDTNQPPSVPEDEMQQLFDGAPAFSIDETAGTYGEPNVRYVTFSAGMPKDSTSAFEDADPIDHEAFRGCSNRKLPAGEAGEGQHHWLVGPKETPSMSSAFGKEAGSTGWQYFLEAQMVDLELEVGLTSGEIDEYAHELYAPESIGVRSIDSTIMVDRLRDIGKYHENGYRLEGDMETEERLLYGQLFTQVLYPTKTDSNHAGAQEYGLESQCRELFKVLEERRVWLDFSRPEERIRMGSILYGAGEEKLLLVLQILLSCELWLRLKLLHCHLPLKLELEPLYFTPKVNWDLAVAQKWLNNVRIVERPFTPDFEMVTPSPAPQKLTSWHKFFFADENKMEDAEEPQDADTYDAYFVPQHLERQLNGLLLFAQKIGWPGIEMLEGVIRDKLRDTAGLQTPSIAYKTPATSPGKLTPRSIGTNRGSYFGYYNSRHTSSAVVRNMGQGGWLSRTYNTGLVLPGEGLSHLLMGCLLEHDTLALNEIGDQGSMYGGIIRRTLETYGSTASWWSINNIVGRVLATETTPQNYAGWVGKCVGVYSAKAKTYEDMAQISAVAAKVMRNMTSSQTSSARNGFKLTEPIGWVDVLTDRKRKKPRLSVPGNVEKDSTFSGFRLSEDHQFAMEEFEYPQLSPSKEFQVDVLGLKFWGNDALNAPSLPELEQGYYQPTDEQDGDAIRAYQVEVVFRIPSLDDSSSPWFDSMELDTAGLVLRYDISFVTSYPCKQRGIRRPSASPFETSFPKLRAQDHPLHSSYKYKVVDLDDIQKHKPAKRHESEKASNDDHFITVINAIGTGEGAYVYAKAWCAKWGTDAIISRPSRTCLSCAIREANALAIDVIICLGNTDI